MSRDRGGDSSSWETTGVMRDADYGALEARYMAHARAGDPLTSSLAAASVTGLTATQQRILDLLKRHGDLTRDALQDAWRSEFPADHTSDQSIRSRLSELMDEGRVEPVGEALNVRGRRVQIVGLKRGPVSLF